MRDDYPSLIFYYTLDKLRAIIYNISNKGVYIYGKKKKSYVGTIIADY